MKDNSIKLEYEACQWIRGKLELIEKTLLTKVGKESEKWAAKRSKIAKFESYVEAQEAYGYGSITEDELNMAYEFFEGKESIQPENKYTIALSIVRREIQSIKTTCAHLEYEMMTPEQRKEADRKALLAQQKNQEYRHSLDAMVYAARAGKEFGKPFSEGHENGHSKEA